MAEIKISQLPFIGSSLLTDFSTSVQGGTTWQATNLQVLSLMPTVPGIIFPLSQGGLGANITAINNAVFSTNGSGNAQLSTALPAGLTIPGYVTTGSLAAYLPLAGGTMSGDISSPNRYLFQQTSFATTLSQTGILATIVGVSSANVGAYVVPASGSPFTIMRYLGTSTVPVSVSQTIAGGTACTVYYYPNGSPIDATGTGVFAATTLLNSARYLTLGGAEGISYLKINSGTACNNLAVTNGLLATPSNASNQSASQSGTTVTGVGTSWDSTFVGYMIRFGTGATAWITAVGSATSATVTPSQSVSATTFDIPGKTSTSQATYADSIGNFGTNNLYIHGTFNLPNGTFIVGANTAFTGAFTTSFTASANTTLALPASNGTLALTSQIPSLPLSLANGGTNASLTANTGGIVYSAASAMAILAGTATANKHLQSGATAAPTWTTSTYADTYAASTMLYANGANTVQGLATANNAALYTNASGVPAMTALGASKLLASNASSVIAPRSFAVNTQLITATGTYTPTTGTLYAIVEEAGGGGGGGGVAATGASQFAGAGGGSGAEYAFGVFSAATIGASQSVTIGTGGAGGTAGANTGTNGGTTSFGALMTATGGFGGGGGSAQTTGSTVLGPSGGSGGTGGLFRCPGGGGGFASVSISSNIINGGQGGSSRFSGGAGCTLNTAGFAATGYGGGGSGASRTGGGAAAAGGAGSPGIVIVTEFIIN